ncbi:MAG: threonine synthase [Verrucomicrobiales bacterium]|jgi:threonine synthase
MKYVSTRKNCEPASFFEAFANGLAPDGGLYVPEELPSLPEDLISDDAEPYPAVAVDFLELFDTDHTPQEVFKLVDRSYTNFNDLSIAPLRKLDENLSVLELFHGPTLAFKDFGLQLVGNLFEDQIRRTGDSINVLGATSGDTGSAAIHGLADKEGVNVFILYPKGRISEFQERQMTCTGAKNIYPIPIEGSFDDAQRIVKHLFNDASFKRDVRLSAVNSINIARILAQSVYYIHAFMQLPAEKADDVQFVVPTGNFGNIFAGWLAAKMGLPSNKFVVATNQNDILYKLFKTGVYEQGDVHPSYAPSMDIGIASNFERFLYYHVDGDGDAVTKMMSQIHETGRLEIPNFNPDSFDATRTDNEGILTNIKSVYEKYGYVTDPHTACGFTNIDPDRNTIVLGTAHPAKFPDVISKAIGEESKHPALEALKTEPIVNYELEPTADSIKAFIMLNAAI